MAISTKEAYDILELPDTATNEDIIRSYKYLSLHWYPDKHGNTEKALNKFKQVHLAYRKLVGPPVEEEEKLSMKDMLSLFQQVFFGEEQDLNGNDDSDWYDESIETDSDGTDISNSRKSLTAEEARKNAESLIAEEEREKRKAEKRRAKKKRRKEKKKLEKERSSKLKNSQNVNSIPPVSQNSKKEQDQSIPSSSSSETEEEDIDRNSAFVAVAVIKSKKLLASERFEKKHNKRTNRPSHTKRSPSNHLVAPVNKKENKKQLKNSGSESGIDPNSAFVAVAANKSKRNISAVQKKTKEEKPYPKPVQNSDVQNSKDIDPRVLRSRQVAIRGNEMAGVGQYQEAVNLFTEAIRLDPNDHRFFGNRSYCYDRLCLYERALKDSEKAIALAARWPKGYFRKGRALAGLKKFTEAETAFHMVLELDANCKDAEQELFKVRVLQLTEMGFPKQVSEQAIRQYQHVQPAVDALLSGGNIDLQANGGEEIYISDDDDFYPQHKLSQHITDDKMDPRNPEGRLSLWVGNVRQEVTEKMLKDLFTKFGDVISINHMPEKYCAFVNYSDKWAAGRAMQALQGYECCGQQLLIKYPDNPVSNRTNPSVSKKPKPSGSNHVVEPAKTKVSGPVNGDECYFWRTTGCTYGERCRYKHLQENQGIDKKPWHG